MAKPRKDHANDRNLLERVLIECAHASRSVPAETGVGFRVSKPPDDESVCVIYHVDAKKIPPLFKATESRPDYLVFHASASGLILTIVEMKGTAPKNQRHGLTQIQSLVAHLRGAIREHLPSKFRPHLQGVLLTPFGEQVERDALTQIARSGFVLCQLQYHHNAELHPYVSRRLTLKDVYHHTSIRNAEQDVFCPLERLLIFHAEERRRDDAFLRARWKRGQPGIYVNYDGAQTLSGKRHVSGYLALAGDPATLDLGVHCPDGKLTEALREQLETRLGLPAQRRLLRLLAIERG